MTMCRERDVSVKKLVIISELHYVHIAWQSHTRRIQKLQNKRQVEKRKLTQTKEEDDKDAYSSAMEAMFNFIFSM